MSNVTGEVTKRLLSAGRGQPAHGRLRTGGLFVVVLTSLVLVASLVVFLTASLPVIVGLGFDYREYYRNCPTAMVVLPRALPIGVVAGVVAGIVAAKLGEHLGGLFAACMAGLLGVSVIVALAFLAGGGLSSTNYLGADAADIFLIALLPIGVPAVIGAFVGGRIVALS